MRLRWSILTLALLPVLATTAYAALPLLEPAETPLSEVGFADFNNDGRTDMVERVFATGDLRVRYNIGDRFNPTPNWIGYADSAPDGVNWDTLFADIDGDGLADAIDRDRSNGNLCVHRNLGSDFNSPASCILFPFSRPSPRWRTFLAPIDGDARADMVSVDQQTGTIYVHRNNGAGFDTTPLFTQSGPAVPSYPSGNWQQFFADCTGDGKADLLNLDQTSNTFYCHQNNTTSFAAVTGVIFPGPPEIYERELTFGQFNAGGIADIVSHDLRTGDIVVLPVLADGAGRYTGHISLLRDRSPAYTRSAGQQALPAEPVRSVTSIAVYDNDHAPNPARPDVNGWFSLYPGAPGTVTPGFTDIYRSDTPLLGLYASGASTTIRQHSYWLRASGADVAAVDHTNCPQNSPLSADPGSLEAYCDDVRTTITNILSVTAGVRDFVPPRVFVMMRIFDSNYTQATAIADDLYAIYQSNPGSWYRYNDGSANKDKPLLLVFVDFTTPWLTAPQWTDPRFNIRYTNGYMDFGGLTTADSLSSSYMTGDLPYWNFVENAPDPTRPTGYYRHIYRRMPTDTTQSEESSIWTSYWLGGTSWDGQTDVQDGKITIDRSAESVAGKPPRNLLVGRFNYPIAWLAEAQEGISTDESSYFEPSVFTGWTIYDKVSNAVYNLKKQRRGAPGKPVVTYRDAAAGKIVFESANYPTQYCVSPTTTCEKWEFIDVRTTCPKQVAAGSSFYLRTRNPFGDSDPVFVTGTFGTSPPICPNIE